MFYHQLPSSIRSSRISLSPSGITIASGIDSVLSLKATDGGAPSVVPGLADVGAVVVVVTGDACADVRTEDDGESGTDPSNRPSSINSERLGVMYLSVGNTAASPAVAPIGA